MCVLLSSGNAGRVPIGLSTTARSAGSPVQFRALSSYGCQSERQKVAFMYGVRRQQRVRNPDFFSFWIGFAADYCGFLRHCFVLYISYSRTSVRIPLNLS